MKNEKAIGSQRLLNTEESIGVTTSEDGWNVWANHVLSEQRRQSDALEKLYNTLVTMQVEIGQLKVKSGLWGACAGVLTVAVVLTIDYLKDH